MIRKLSPQTNSNSLYNQPNVPSNRATKRRRIRLRSSNPVPTKYCKVNNLSEDLSAPNRSEQVPAPKLDSPSETIAIEFDIERHLNPCLMDEKQIMGLEKAIDHQTSSLTSTQPALEHNTSNDQIQNDAALKSPAKTSPASVEPISPPSSAMDSPTTYSRKLYEQQLSQTRRTMQHHPMVASPEVSEGLDKLFDRSIEQLFLVERLRERFQEEHENQNLWESMLKAPNIELGAIRDSLPAEDVESYWNEFDTSPNHSSVDTDTLIARLDSHRSSEQPKDQGGID